jgi:beta-N-acetylhexosaminidase
MSILLTILLAIEPCIVTQFYGEEVNDDARRLVEEAQVAGFILFRESNGLTSDEQVRTLCHDLQALADYPLIVAIDQEGGRVSHIHPEKWGAFPNNAITDEAEAYWVAREMAQELAYLGITHNLAPVVDINSSERSFGHRVLPLAEATLRGLADGGVKSCLKHFPGLTTEVDSHLELPIVDTLHLEPFYLESDMVMVGHMVAPQLSDICASRSPEVIRYLREEIGFEGLIITDALDMGGFLQGLESIEEGAVQARQAGCDLLLLVHFDVEQVLSIHRALLADALRDERGP